MMSVTVKVGNVNKVLSAVREEIEELASEVVEGIWVQLVSDTPIDTGTAERSWQVVALGGTAETLERYDRRGTPIVFPGVPESALRGDGVSIVSGVDYMSALNNGWSSQAPSNFVEIAVDKALLGFS
ncbi:hypothetical protein [Zhongshania sp.]|uniref:hypothetical protein n=1 Tax=Zhongshania sp. TaxID=1971902 RepID=UPI00356443C1